MLHHVKKHGPQFMLYLISGGSATAVNYLSYLLLFYAGMYYVVASIISDIIGFISAFVFHKYFVFKKKGKMTNHFGRYCILGIWNTFAISVIVYFSVEFMSVPEEFAKLIGIAVVVSWNFVLYKIFVYV